MYHCFVWTENGMLKTLKQCLLKFGYFSGLKCIFKWVYGCNIECWNLHFWLFPQSIWTYIEGTQDSFMSLLQDATNCQIGIRPFHFLKLSLVKDNSGVVLRKIALHFLCLNPAWLLGNPSCFFPCQHWYYQLRTR